MNDTKSVFQSKTFWGLVMMVSPEAWTWIGNCIQSLQEHPMPAWAKTLLTVAGFLWALLGRYKAQTRLTL